MATLGDAKSETLVDTLVDTLDEEMVDTLDETIAEVEAQRPNTWLHSKRCEAQDNSGHTG